MTVQFYRASFFSPANAAGGFQVLFAEVLAFLKVVHALDAVAPLQLLTNDLRRLDGDPLLPHQVLSVLQHRYRIRIRVLRIEVRRTFVELHATLPNHSPLLFFSSFFSDPFISDFFFFLPLLVLCSCFLLPRESESHESTHSLNPSVRKAEPT